MGVQKIYKKIKSTEKGIKIVREDYAVKVVIMLIAVLASAIWIWYKTVEIDKNRGD